MYLLQESENVLKPIAYASRLLRKSERNYSVVEKECLSILWSIEKFKLYLFGREFILQTDHNPLIYLNKMSNSNDRLMRWSLALQQYSFSVEFIKGSENVGADLMSRCAIKTEDEESIRE